MTREPIFGQMTVIATDQFSGRRYRCPCGWEGWTVWGRARDHAKSCPKAMATPERGYDKEGKDG